MISRLKIARWVCCLFFGLFAIVGAGCGRSRGDVDRERFQSADVDGSGDLTVGEFASAAVDVAVEELPDNFASADKDEDQRLSFDEFEAHLHPYRKYFWALGIFSLVSFVGSLVAIPFVVARLPEDHFVAEHTPADWVNSTNARRAWLIVKNLLGILLIVGGVLMLILPGQGLLTVLLGIALTDLPLRWRLVRALARRPQIMKALNWMRRRADRPPMLPPDDPPPRRLPPPSAAEGPTAS